MSPLMTMLILSPNAALWLKPTMHDLWHSHGQVDTFWRTQELAADIARQHMHKDVPSPYWVTTKDSYELKMRLPEVDPQSVSAALSSDGKAVELVGERKIDGCSCRPTLVEQVKLPYRPRETDVSVNVNKDGVLALKLARHATTDAPTPLVVKHETPEAKEGGEAPPGTRPLSFVPHESAVKKQPASVDEQEKSLAEKFRSVALASLATAPPTAAHEVATQVAAETRAGASVASSVEATAQADETPDGPAEPATVAADATPSEA